MGSGKTTLAKALKNDPAFNTMIFIDVDDHIEKTEGRKISDIFKSDGESYFRDIETKALKDIAGDERTKIVSCGNFGTGSETIPKDRFQGTKKLFLNFMKRGNACTEARPMLSLIPVITT